MFCKKCGKQLKDGAQFCQYCGEKVTAPGAAASRKEPESVRPEIKQQEIKALAQIIPGRSVSTPEPVKRAGISRNVIIIAAAAVIIAAAGIVIWSARGDKSGGNRGPEEAGKVFAEKPPEETARPSAETKKEPSKESEEMVSSEEPSIRESETPEQEPASSREEQPEEELEESSREPESLEEEPAIAADSQYILPDSDSKYLTRADLEGLSRNECRLARNELYARHGRKFNAADLQDYFNHCEWYEARIEPEDFHDESILNPYEIANRDLIVQYEKDMGY